MISDWSVIGGDYTVGPGGGISLPFVGDLSAAGKTTSEIATEIGKKLQDEFALRTTPSASVEIAQFRPVCLAGDVETPGEYPFAPNLTVLKAVSLAGGLRRSDAGQRFARDFINARGDAAVHDTERSRLVARKARLLAGVEGASAIKIPPELAKAPNAQSLNNTEESDRKGGVQGKRVG